MLTLLARQYSAKSAFCVSVRLGLLLSFITRATSNLASFKLVTNGSDTESASYLLNQSSTHLFYRATLSSSKPHSLLRCFSTTTTMSFSNDGSRPLVDMAEIKDSCDSKDTIEPKEMDTVIAEKDDGNGLNKDYSSELPQTQTLSKRALKRQARAQMFKEMKKRRKVAPAVSSNKEEPGYGKDEFDETSYYFENGLRKVYPYHFVFATHAKGRWVGRTLKDVLEGEFGFSHPNAVDLAFVEKRIQVNHKLVSPDYVLKNCDYISHQIHRHENPVTDAPIEVLEDNEDVIVVNKPASIPCHPCGRYRYNSLVFILGKEMGKSNLRNIYRLDRMTSGVLILGKTVKSTKLLEDQVMNRQVQKEYVCRVVGEFPSEPVTVDQPLAALSNKLRLQIISPKGKSSQTTFQRLSYNGLSSVVKCTPHTGRTHQIRVHLQYLGHPILNDAFYNSDAWGPNGGKDGVYELPHDVTCARIYQTHTATQWEGGDNPIFYEKLREDSKSNMETGKEETPPSNPPETTNSPNSVIDPSNKSSEMSLTSTCDKVTSDQQEDDQTAAPSSECDLRNGQKVVENDGGGVGLGPNEETRKGSVDLSCDMCRKKCVDPQPRDLVMFLHALKYKGPGWEYETQLPDWAKEDWSQEDQYEMPSTLLPAPQVS